MQEDIDAALSEVFNHNQVYVSNKNGGNTTTKSYGVVVRSQNIQDKAIGYGLNKVLQQQLNKVREELYTSLTKLQELDNLMKQQYEEL